MLKTVARHVTATIMALVTTLAYQALGSIGVAPEVIASLLASVEEVLTMAILVGSYAVWEKLLKPIFGKYVGEKQDG
jgi:hypothetical protein